MLFVAQGALAADDCSQPTIAALNKSHLIQTGEQLFQNMMAHGILLLNASLVLSDQPVQKDAKAWRSFMAALLREISLKNNDITLLLMGNISKVITKLPEAESFEKVISEHPYNVSFIANTEIIQFFKHLQLLQPLSVEYDH